VISTFWGIHLTGVTQASCSPRAVRWRALETRRVSARLQRCGWHCPEPPGGEKALVSQQGVGDGELEDPLEHHAEVSEAAAVDADQLIRVAGRIHGIHRALCSGKMDTPEHIYRPLRRVSARFRRASIAYGAGSPDSLVRRGSRSFSPIFPPQAARGRAWQLMIVRIPYRPRMTAITPPCFRICDGLSGVS